MTYVSLAKTPADWLLEWFDHESDNPRRRHTTHERQMAQVIEDHMGDCRYGLWGCTFMSTLGAARWPEPFPGRDIGAIEDFHRRRTAA